MSHARLPFAFPMLALAGAALLNCSSSSSPASGGDTGDDGGDNCYPDNDGISAGSYTFDLTVDDIAFSKMVLSTQNEAEVTVNLKNMGTKPHGFEVECTSVTPAYPHLPAGCSPTSCFPAGSTIAPLAPGASASVTFITPVADDLVYPFKSSEASDSTVPGLNNGQWNLM